MRSENCPHGAIKQISKNLRGLGSFLHENCRNVFSKICVNFGCCYGYQEEAEVIENTFFAILVHLNCQKVSNL